MLRKILYPPVPATWIPGADFEGFSTPKATSGTLLQTICGTGHGEDGPSRGQGMVFVAFCVV